jgi:uncharacterized membrane protein
MLAADDAANVSKQIEFKLESHLAQSSLVCLTVLQILRQLITGVRRRSDLR